MLYLVGIIRMNSTIDNNLHIYHALAHEQQTSNIFSYFFILYLSSLCMGPAFVLSLYISADYDDQINAGITNLENFRVLEVRCIFPLTNWSILWSVVG